MVCTLCGSETKVINSRHQKRLNQVWRRRQCQSCHMIFTTEETVDYSGSWRVKRPKGALEPFQRDKLLLSVYRSCQHRETALADSQGLTDTIIARLSQHIRDGLLDRQLIIQTTIVALNRFDNAASTHYQAHHKS